MPSFNQEAYIAQAIESVLTQTFHELELIIVDDCSSDDSRKVIENYGLIDPRIRPIYHNHTLGNARTVNDGINAARGEFIAFIDSDDIWESTKLEKQLQVLSADENLVVWSNGEIIDAKGNSRNQTFCDLFPPENNIRDGDVFQQLLFENFIFNSSVIIKSSNLGEIRRDETLKTLNDYLFNVELARKYRFHCMQEILCSYRIHGKNAILRNKKIWKQEEIRIRFQFLRKYGRKMSFRTVFYQLLKLFIISLSPDQISWITLGFFVFFMDKTSIIKMKSRFSRF